LSCNKKYEENKENCAFDQENKCETNPKKPHSEAIVLLPDTGFHMNNSSRQERAFSEPLRQIEGKYKGNINGSFQIKQVNTKIPEQMKYGVHSEHGISLYYSSVLSMDMISEELPSEVFLLKIKSHKKILALQNIKDEFISIIGISEGDFIQKNVMSLISQIQKLMKTTLFGKERHKSFFYPSLKSLHNAQKIMLEITDEIVKYSESLGVEENIESMIIISKSLKSLMKRSELARPQILTKKNKNSELYHEVLKKCLRLILPAYFSLKKANIKRSFIKPIKSCSLLLLAIAYYNFPQIRNKILGSVTRKKCPKIEELLKNCCENEEIHNDSEHSLMNLVSGFVEKIENNDPILCLRDWTLKLQKMHSTYYRFIMIWIKYSEKLLRNAGKSTWKCIEGYYDLIKPILIKIYKMRNIDDLNKSVLLQTLQKILGNEDLLYPLINIVFNKTKYFSIFL